MKQRSPYLSKSRFKIALECLTKLYYTGKKTEYADENLNDPFLQALAKGGFQVGELAKYYFTDNPVAENITISTLNAAEAIEETKKRLSLPGRVVIAEGAFIFGNLFIRADIVVKENNTLLLYEVKAKSVDNENDDPDSFLNKKRDQVATGWVPYLYDLAFQKYVMANCDYSKGYAIKAHLMMADKDAYATIDGINQLFKIVNKDGGHNVVVPEGLTRAQLGNKILKEINLDDVIENIWDKFSVPNDYQSGMKFSDFVKLAESTYVKNEKIFAPIGSKCKGCQFYASADKLPLKSGFHECWKNHTKYSPELLEKPLVTELWGGLAGNTSFVKKLIDGNTFLLENVNEADIMPASGNKKKEKPGLTPFERRVMQINKVKNNQVESHIDINGLENEIANFNYPFHMIDFETSMVALPFHKNLKPYQGVAFQFSHHIMHQNGTIEHKGEFLETQPGKFPNYDFVRALKQQLETDNGTIFRYHNHENSYLNMLAKQLQTNPDAPADKEELISFIRTITRRKEENTYIYGERDMVDLYDLVLRYYYPPYAKGSNSLKQILPSIIRDSKHLQEKYSTAGVYGKTFSVKSLNFDDHIWIQHHKNLDPYKTLPQVFEGYDRNTLDALVSDFDELGDGGAALTAYNYLQFAEVHETQRTAIANALLRYCELDTMAMVMIMEGWQNIFKKH